MASVISVEAKFLFFLSDKAWCLFSRNTAFFFLLKLSFNYLALLCFADIHLLLIPCCNTFSFITTETQLLTFPLKQHILCYFCQSSFYVIFNEAQLLLFLLLSICYLGLLISAEGQVYDFFFIFLLKHSFSLNFV